MVLGVGEDGGLDHLAYTRMQWPENGCHRSSEAHREVHNPGWGPARALVESHHLHSSEVFRSPYVDRPAAERAVNTASHGTIMQLIASIVVDETIGFPRS
jgi:hypothetical protein